MSDTQKLALKKIKKSINLPKTSFPMKANLSQNEPTSLKKWKKNNLYTRIVEKNKDKPSFIFHDGPPYANGNIHVGHLLNKVLKDFVVRSQHLLGKQCKYIPGWDCHGLPIEHKVLQELSNSGHLEKIKTLSSDQQKQAIRNECAKYAKKFIKLQSQQMQSLLTLADYDNPYLTMNKHYEKNVLNVFSELVQKGLVYRKLKPVHWSIANQTALAEAELEYYQKKDLSVYVKFNLIDQNSASKLFKIELKEPVSILIWTTTPWTLPANLAVAIHKDFDYSLVQSTHGYLIIAKERVQALSSLVDTPLTTLSTIKGAELLGLTYSHPFIQHSGTIYHADYVNLEDGSGLVHIAPGHGTDDYLVGLEHGLDTYCPVLEDGRFDQTVPEWIQDMSIWDANPIIVNKLKELNSLFYEYEFNHSYPHDWRSKTPVIFRSTEQWFIGVDQSIESSHDTLRSLALKTIDNDIEFYPEWGKNRLRGMLEARPDWCISRQRSWGLPIPAFRSNGVVLLTQKSVLAISKVFASEGSDAWFKLSAQDLLSQYDNTLDPDCPEGFDVNNAEKMFDIFDVWFESGSSWHAVMEQRQHEFPIDLYLEGSDQHRGWFHLSLLPCLGVHQTSPFKRLLTHGFIVDKEGHKMSKSQGNALNVQDLLNQYGAEVARWWVSSLSYENDIKVDISFFDIAGDSYRKIRNTIRFLLSNLYDAPSYSNPDELNKALKTIPDNSLESLLLSKTSDLDRHVKQAYKHFQFKRAHQLIYDFCNDTLSSFYCSVVKDCLYCDAPDSINRRRIQATLRAILEILIRLLGPLLPHTAEEAYQALYNDGDLLLMLAPDYELPSITASTHWDKLLLCRQDVLKLLESYKQQGIDNSLDAGVKLPNQYESFESDHFQLSDFFCVSRVTFHEKESIEIVDLRDQPRCERSWKRDGSVRERVHGIFLSERDAELVENEL